MSLHSFVIPRLQGYFIRFELFPVPRVGNLTKKNAEKFKCHTYTRTPHLLPNIDTCISARSKFFYCNKVVSYFWFKGHHTYVCLHLLLKKNSCNEFAVFVKNDYLLGSCCQAHDIFQGHTVSC